MKRPARGLVERIATFEALLNASRRARLGKRRAPSTAAFELRLEEELLQLERELRDGTFRFGPYRTFTIREPAERAVSAAPYRDRVVHHAICWEVEPLIEHRLIEDTYACRLGKGTHRAVARLERFLRGGQWVVKVDVRKYFHTIDHAILLDALDLLIGDDRLRALLRQLLATHQSGEEYFFPIPGDDPAAARRPRGLPIGNLTSQLFANFYLAPLDHFIKHVLRAHRYVRYMDDLVLVAPTREVAREWLHRIRPELARLRLTPHPRKTQIFPVTNGVPFLGFRLYPHRRRILRSNLRRFTRRMRERMHAVERGALPEQNLRASLCAWLGFAYGERHGALVNQILSGLPYTPPGATLPRTFWIPRG